MFLALRKTAKERAPSQSHSELTGKSYDRSQISCLISTLPLGNVTENERVSA